MQTTKEMRARIRELTMLERDDFDRAVNMLLEDFETLERGYDCAVKGRQDFRSAYRRALAEQKED
jgi:hypothetical protein